MRSIPVTLLRRNYTEKIDLWSGLTLTVEFDVEWARDLVLGDDPRWYVSDLFVAVISLADGTNITEPSEDLIALLEDFGWRCANAWEVP